MDKAIEAAADAVEDTATVSLRHDGYLTNPTECARAAIRAYLSALKEDPEVVERIAWAMARSTEDPDNPIIVIGRYNKIQARAALSALEME